MNLRNNWKQWEKCTMMELVENFFSVYENIIEYRKPKKRNDF